MMKSAQHIRVPIRSNSAKSVTAVSLSLLSVFMLSGCAIPKDKLLENVAKEWSKTIRASQVIPVYPLREDITPGTVLLVPTSIKNQTTVYDQSGFLPIDHEITRLSTLDYQSYYQQGYWSGDFSKTPHQRPGLNNSEGSLNEVVIAPRAGFPTYSFSIDRNTGIAAALPIQSIPIAFGFLNTKKATASVTLDDAYTYGIPSEEAYRKLIAWYLDDPTIRTTLNRMANQSKRNGSEQADGAYQGLYLRVITRVYFARSVKVTITSDEIVDANATAGIFPSIKTLSAADVTAQKVEERISAYNKLVNGMTKTVNGKALNPTSGTGPAATTGGSIKFTQLTASSVSMNEEFKRAVIIGISGFDVKINDKGELSAPIPSFVILNDDIPAEDKAAAFDFEGFDAWIAAQIQEASIQNQSPLTKAYLKWLTQPDSKAERRNTVSNFLASKGKSDLDPASLQNEQHKDLLEEFSLETDFNAE